MSSENQQEIQYFTTESMKDLPFSEIKLTECLLSCLKIHPI